MYVIIFIYLCVIVFDWKYDGKVKNERRKEYIVFEKSVSLPSSFPKKLLQCTDKEYLGHKKERPLLILVFRQLGN